MSALDRPSLAERVAGRLRGELLGGRWEGPLPGVRSLAEEYGVSHPVMREAMRRLEEEGLVKPAEAGRPRMVARRAPGGAGRPLRVAFLLEMRMEDEEGWFQLVLRKIQGRLERMGHECRFSEKCLNELGHDLGKIRRHVEGRSADAWVVVGGTAETLSWFAGRETPAMAIGGRCREVPIASTGRDTLGAFREACRHLTGLGHRRIVFVSSREMRRPEPSRHALALARELEACGGTAGPYNAPDWEETPEGLEALLARMFRLTPPTAMLVENENWMAGVLSFLMRRRMRVPEDVSLVCFSRSPAFRWQRPAMAGFGGDPMEMAGHVVRWVESVARSRPDRSCHPCDAKFVPGESTAPPRE